ncbi:MAG: hypothetical protein C3F12_01420 [Candidatus Methylomirabilota bacterium]|nr:MAG: hypothetical protein C3F12_01420 [candidate division NC10 bacterium]
MSKRDAAPSILRLSGGLSFESIARLIREMKAMGVTILIIGDLHACGGGTFGVRVGSRHCLKRLWDGGGTA